MKEYDLAVVGLGIVGASAVYAAAWAGARVVALDAGAPGAGTSGTSFAWLNSVHKEPEAYHRLNAAGMTAHRELSRELGGDAGYHDGGSLEWAEAGDAERELRERVRRLADRGYPAQWIARDRAIALEPTLAVPDHVHEVAFYAADAWLDAPRLIERLLAAASARGADIRVRTACTTMRPRGGRVEALVVDGDAVAAASVLVCVGPATQAFLDPLGVAMPVGRVPGLLAVTSRPSEALHRVIHAPGIHLRPDAGGGLLLGAEDIDDLAANAGPSAHAALADRLLERAAGVVPAARAAKIVDARIGVRPMPADRHTIAGRIPGFTNAWMIATHSGVTLGPLLGRLLADEIVRGVPSPTLAPFRPDRFATARAMAG
jgi:glycine/D-amino acid oxidase-like deaminating enzyme